MSPKLRVEAQKDEHGHLNWLKIFRGNRNKAELQLSEIWDADGLTRQIVFDGKRAAMPSVMDIVSLFHQSFIERIGLVKLINLIETIETVETIDLVSLITLIAEVTNIKNIESLDLIDKITLIDAITDIGTVANVTNLGTVNLVNTITTVGTVTNLGTLNLVNTISQITNIANIQSLDLIDAITEISNISSVDLIDRITLIDDITTIGTVTNLGTLNLVNTISTITDVANVQSIDLIDLITEITKIGSVKVIGKDASNVARRSTISNHGTTALWVSSEGTKRRGKFFTSHCMGFISTIQVYCKNGAPAGKTLTVYISPNPALGYVATADITLGALAGEAWRTATFNMMWNYDKLFVWVAGEDVNVSVAYDNEDANKRDAYYSSDSGASWSGDTLRYWFKVTMIGETEGDNNVTGTVNTIKVPSVSDERIYETETLNSNLEFTLLSLDGSGQTEQLEFKSTAEVSSHRIVLRVYTDGKEALNTDPLNLNTDGFTATTPNVSLLQYAVDGLCVIWLTCHFTFQKNLKVTAMRLADSPNQNVLLSGLVNLVK